MRTAITLYAADVPPAQAKIDWHAIMTRHDITLNQGAQCLPLGNGEFCFGVRDTGLQTLQVCNRPGHTSVPSSEREYAHKPAQEAGKAILSEACKGWGCMVKLGATTIWEHRDVKTAEERWTVGYRLRELKIELLWAVLLSETDLCNKWWSTGPKGFLRRRLLPLALPNPMLRFVRRRLHTIEDSLAKHSRLPLICPLFQPTS